MCDQTVLFDMFNAKHIHLHTKDYSGSKRKQNLILSLTNERAVQELSNNVKKEKKINPTN